MIVKFLQSKISKGSQAINYLLNKKRVEEKTAYVIRGHEQFTNKIIKENPYSQKATMGVLSFKESSITERVKNNLMQSFEELLFPNMPKEEVNFLWVEHTDKGRLELNFVIPKIHLKTGKSLQPYYDRADRSRVDIWKKIQNLKYNFHSPDKTENEQSSTKVINETFNKMTTKLEENINEQISNGCLKNRGGLIKYILSLGIEINKKKDGQYHEKYLSIKFKNSKKSIRLKGDIYNEQFRDYAELGKIFEERKRKIRKEKEAYSYDEINKLEERLISYQVQKSSALSKLYNNSIAYDVDTLQQINQSDNHYSIAQLLELAKRKRKKRLRAESSPSSNKSIQETPERGETQKGGLLREDEKVRRQADGKRDVNRLEQTKEITKEDFNNEFRRIFNKLEHDVVRVNNGIQEKLRSIERTISENNIQTKRDIKFHDLYSSERDEVIVEQIRTTIDGLYRAFSRAYRQRQTVREDLYPETKKRASRPSMSPDM